MKLVGKLRTCNTTSIRPRPEATKRNGNSTEHLGNTWTPLKKKRTPPPHHEQDVTDGAEQGRSDVEFGQRLSGNNEQGETSRMERVDQDNRILETR